MINDEIIELKDRFVEELSPEKIYLFGSCADDTCTADSDYDFYIVIDDNTDSVIEVTTRAYASIREIKQRPVDILVRKHSHFENRKNMPTIEQEVFKRGILLYG